MRIKPQNFEEKLVWYSIIGTYVLYFLGLLYIGIPVLAWFLLFYLWKKLLNQTENTPAEERIIIPIGVWIWVASMLVMELAVVVSHINLELGLAKIIQSSFSWGRTWALMALFPLIGCLRIRPKLVYRATCILCLQSLVISLVCYLLYCLHLPSIAYITPLGYVSDKLTTPVNLFIGGADGTGEFRLNLFTDFANSLGIVGSIFFCLVWQESDKKLRWISMIGAAIMVVGSASRMTTFCLVVVPLLTWVLTNFTWPVQIATGVISLLAGMFAFPIIDFFLDIYDTTIKGYRSSSEQARSRLREIALELWTEYPIWGHGVVEMRGPQAIGTATPVGAIPPIGTHNQWPDLLFLKGLVGCIAFIVPLVWSFVDLLTKAQKNATAKVGLSVLLVIFISSSGADLDWPVYVYWPGLVIIGIAFKEKVPHVVTSSRYALIKQSDC